MGVATQNQYTFLYFRPPFCLRFLWALPPRTNILSCTFQLFALSRICSFLTACSSFGICSFSSCLRICSFCLRTSSFSSSLRICLLQVIRICCCARAKVSSTSSETESEREGERKKERERDKEGEREAEREGKREREVHHSIYTNSRSTAHAAAMLIYKYIYIYV